LSTVCCIYATAPFIQKNDFIKAYEIFKTNQWNSVFSGTKFSFPIQRAFKKIGNGRMKMFNLEHFYTRSQDLTEAYHDADQFAWGKPFSWINKEVSFDKNSTFYELPSWRVQDIDTKEDWYRAELIMELLKNNNFYC
jgi:pseudaminic acid cytidylyltransferase